MKIIKLTQGQETVVDDWNFDFLNQWKWLSLWSKDAQGYYAVRWDYVNNKRMMIYMHRVIMKTPDGMKTDHIDGDTLFNLECNLRICTHSENMRNRGKNKNNKSGYKGVYWDSHAGKYRSRIMYNKKIIYLGLYDDPIEAAMAYDEKARELHGEFAGLNFG